MTRRRKALGMRGSGSVASDPGVDPGEGPSRGVGNVLVQDTVEVVEESQEPDNPHDVINTSQSSKKDRKRQPNIKAYIFSDCQEQDLADWYKDHPVLYNRRDKNYKRTAMKDVLYSDKCKTFDPNCTGKSLISFNKILQ
jgi:hypothetical protein